MKLCRYGPAGAEKPGLVDHDGRIRALDVADITPDLLSPESLQRQGSGIDPGEPLVDGSPRYGVPVNGVSKFVAIGLNYADHAAEANLPIPTEPVVFNKWISCLQGANDPVTIPCGSTKTDWEVELGIVIGTRARYVERGEALAHVAGYLCVNDVSERHWQTERGPTWDKGKGFDTFGPVGPWLVTADEVGDPQDLALWLEVNGRRVQEGSTRTMIFGIAEIIAYCSQIMTLEPGDIITTGTPPGVGMGQKPAPWFLKAGDVVTLGVEGLGQQRQEVVAWTPA
jgi:2-keto-4-pentenoate hydratase/2-oxohepta-3-ene-1,7-dioic acid hydratase in catechol pathway